MQNEIRYMRKLYFMMFLQSIIVFVALLVKSLILIKEKGVSTLEQFKKSLLNHNFGLWFSILVCLLLSLISNRSIAKLKSPVNIFIWLAFVLSLSILFCYLNVLHENCSFLILSLISA
jgi:FtsH-binding integral membrane protein